ncbi:MAG: iron-containing alcohol dehydrogenase [Eubacterium sp.]|nr:iron-containing alcohol dehydrogenase [Eubacterium sp.]
MLWTLKKCWYRLYQRVFKVAMCFMDWSEPKLLEGAGSVLQLPEFIKDKGLTKILVVTDKGLMGLHLLDPMFEKLTEVGIDYVVYDGVQPNPTIPNIEECKDLYVQNGCQGIIAFGGGSPMDCAKAAAARVVKPRQSVRKMRGYLKVLHKLPPFFAVPTTAGTGSETTVAAVVTDPETHEKNAINDICLRPKYAVLDPALTVGLPPHITSTTGMDALTHAVEAYIGKSNVKSTIWYAENATVLIHDNLEKAYADGKDIRAREAMLKASFYAGCAFTRAYVGYVHAIAHNLGGLYGTPHGLANAVILPYVLDWYADAAYPQLAKLADLIGVTTPNMSTAEKGKAFIAEIRRMNKAMNIPEKFDFIKEEDMPTLVKRALKEGNPGYPVPKIMAPADCEAVIRSFMA